jgi:hypothetical protein
LNAIDTIGSLNALSPLCTVNTLRSLSAGIRTLQALHALNARRTNVTRGDFDKVCPSANRTLESNENVVAVSVLNIHKDFSKRCRVFTNHNEHVLRVQVVIHDVINVSPVSDNLRECKIRRRNTLQALNSLRPLSAVKALRTLNPIKSLCALCALSTINPGSSLCPLSPGRAFDTLNTLHSCRAGQSIIRMTTVVVVTNRILKSLRNLRPLLSRVLR